AASQHCSSTEAAVEWIMSRSSRKEITPALTEAARNWLPCEPASETWQRTEIVKSTGPSVAESLMALGFPEAQAKAAGRRCSSVEAAVEWLALHPDPE
ncbi:unnamed protein product, partial [Polarella glacialis]